MFKSPREQGPRKTAKCAVVLRPEEKERLEDEARRLDCSSSWVIRQALLARWGLQ